MARRLAIVRQRFEAELDDADNFFHRATNAIDPATGRPLFTAPQKLIVAETTFLLGCVAWERFLEYSLAHYVTGERSASGYRPRRLVKLATSFTAAQKIFGGDSNFVGWIDSGTVLRRAKKWLRGGEPYATPLGSAGTLLSYLQKIRNVVAHDSDSTFTSLEKETRNLYGALPPKHSAGGQLLAPCPSSLGVGGSNLLATAFASYRLMAVQIAP